MKKLLYKWIFFKMMGWKIVGTINPDIKKCVMMVMPHTSAHDFYLGIFTRGIVGLEMNFVAKKELFRFPFGYYFNYMGGAALDRSGGLNKVDSIAAIFDKKETFRLAVAPEGFGQPLHPSGELATDLQLLNQHFVGVEGKIPENGYRVIGSEFSK